MNTLRSIVAEFVSDLLLFTLFASFFYFCGMIGVVLWGVGSILVFIYLMKSSTIRRVRRFSSDLIIIALFYPLLGWWLHCEPKIKRAFGVRA